jgi:hypothetical protein
MKEYKLIYPAGQKPVENEEIIFSEKSSSGGDSQTGRSSSFVLKDMDTKENLEVRAIISSKHEDLPDGDVLWIQNEESYDVDPEAWRIKILEFIEEEEEEVKVLPKMRISMGKQRGGMLKNLMNKDKQ